MSEYKEAYAQYKKHGERFAKTVHHHALSTPKKVLISSLGVLVIALLTVQLFFSNERMLPFAKIEGVQVSNKTKKQALEALDGAYSNVRVPIYFTGDEKPKVTPAYADLGVTVRNEVRIQNYHYPWYMRIIPGSLFWYGLVDQSGEATAVRDGKKLDEYFARYFGADCVLEPVNATLAVEKNALKVIPSVSGGTCEYTELHPKLEKVATQLNPDKIVVKGTTKDATIPDEKAIAEKRRLEAVLQKGLVLQVADRADTVTGNQLYEWLVFAAHGDAIVVGLDAQKADAWLVERYGKQFEQPAGVTTVVTRDFTEVSRTVGRSGQAINAAETRLALEAQLRGTTASSKVLTRVVAPTVAYQRSYSPTDEGLSALLKNFAESHAGTYGISMVELSGKKRRAEYNAQSQFTTASTYKLFVAYSALLRVEDGRWRLSDQVVGGRNVEKCIDDMIVLSDNPCAEAMLKRIGYTAITNEARAMGASSTSFLGSNGIKSTARDEATFMGALYSGQILSQQSSRDRLLGALKRNVHRKGVPAGVPGIAVADKVGFLDDLLHDATIVYSPSGAYVLVVLTKGSSWAAIAELAKQVEALRTQ